MKKNKRRIRNMPKALFEPAAINLNNKSCNNVSAEDFAESRFKLHEASPNDGRSIDEFKKYFKDKYNFG